MKIQLCIGKNTFRHRCDGAGYYVCMKVSNRQNYYLHPSGSWHPTTINPVTQKTTGFFTSLKEAIEHLTTAMPGIDYAVSAEAQEHKKIEWKGDSLYFQGDWVATINQWSVLSQAPLLRTVGLPEILRKIADELEREQND